MRNAHGFQAVCTDLRVFNDPRLRFFCCTVHPLLVYHRLSFKPPEDCLHVPHVQRGASATPLSQQHLPLARQSRGGTLGLCQRQECGIIAQQVGRRVMVGELPLTRKSPLYAPALSRMRVCTQSRRRLGAEERWGVLDCVPQPRQAQPAPRESISPVVEHETTITSQHEVVVAAQHVCTMTQRRIVL